MKAVIIAAGFGSRLWNVSNQIPKTLLPFGSGTILSTIIAQLHTAGATELIMVVGFNQKYIRDYLADYSCPMPVKIVENAQWERGNALSVYTVKDAVGGEPFILSMSDHVVCLAALKQMFSHPQSCNLLLVDAYIDSNFDLDDATKVRTEDAYIVEIGKELTGYNALDCGVFRLESDFFAAVETAVAKGNESISAAITELIAAKRMMAVQIDGPNQWLDIDTPEAYEFARDGFSVC